MSMRKIAILLLVAVLAGGIVWWFFRESGDVAAVRRVVDRVCAVLSHERGENPMLIAYRNSELPEYFSFPLRIAIDAPLELGRELTATELTSHAGRIRINFSSLRVDWQDLRVEPVQDGGMTASFTGTLDGVIKSTGENLYEVRAVTLRLRKSDGRWLITEAEARDVLKR